MDWLKVVPFQGGNSYINLAHVTRLYSAPVGAPSTDWIIYATSGGNYALDVTFATQAAADEYIETLVAMA